MGKKYSDEKAVELIYESLQKLKRGETSFEAFAVGVALIIDPTPLIEEDFEWARKTAKSLGLESLLTPLAPDGLKSWGNLGKCTICGKAWEDCSCLTRRW